MAYSPTKMKLIIDGTESTHEVFSMTLGNAQYNGGGMKQLPSAVPDDGIFDLSIIGKISRIKVMRSVNKLYDGSYVSLPEVSTYTGKSVEIISEPKCWVEADGEALGESPFRFEMLARAINVIIP